MQLNCDGSPRDKSFQREFYKQKRRELSAEERTALDKGLCDVFRSFAAGYQKRDFLVFLSNPDEPDTDELINILWRQGDNTFAPVSSKTDNSMIFRSFDSFEQLAVGTFGIREPLSCCRQLLSSEIAAAVCIVPGLCFDRSGYRIGYGRGFYDRFLSENKPFLTVGLCYEKFLADKVAFEAGDIAVEKIITEKRIIECRNKL